MTIGLKCENLQPMGAFKIRGAYNMIASLSPDLRSAGVITYSSGNHGQAVALAARRLGHPCGRRDARNRTPSKSRRRTTVRRRGDLRWNDVSRSSNESGGRSVCSRSYDRSAVRAPLDHCGRWNLRARNTGRATGRVGGVRARWWRWPDFRNRCRSTGTSFHGAYRRSRTRWRRPR